MKKFGVLSLLLVMLLCIGLAATGCTGSTDDDDGTTLDDTASDETTDNEDTEDETYEATDLSIDATVAEVTAVGEGSITVTYYSLAEDNADYVITDAAAVELANYEASSETQELIVDSAWTVWIVEDGVATEGTSDQIVVGDVIIIYTDADGVENIVVYHSEENASDETEDDENDGTETEGDDVSEGGESTEATNNE